MDVATFNQLPASRLALTQLKQVKWPSHGLHLVSLALWGLEQGIRPTSEPEAWTRDEMGLLLTKMERDPALARDLLLSDDPSGPDLRPSQTPMEAAQEVIDSVTMNAF